MSKIGYRSHLIQFLFLEFFERVTALRQFGVKVMIALGGWNDSADDKYSRLVNDPAARKRFIDNVIDFIITHDFDGLDLDWEYPRCWQVNQKLFDCIHIIISFNLWGSLCSFT